MLLFRKAMIRFVVAPFLVVAPLSPSPAAESGDSIPLPIVIAVPNSAAGHPVNGSLFGSDPLDLAPYGYVEQEYFFSGNARIYEYVEPSRPLDTQVHVIRTNPYVNRMLVRKPLNPALFSGNVIIEIINDALSFDALTAWQQAKAQFLNNGDAWVGVTSAPLGIASLQAAEPVRYAALSFNSNDPNRTAQTCPAANTSTTENGIIFDVISQVGALFKTNASTSPLSGLNVKAVYGTGYSAGALLLSTYINAIEPTLAAPPYDGYMSVAGSLPQALNSCSPQDEYITYRDVVPNSKIAAVFQVQTMSEVELLTGLDNQTDSDLPAHRYRYYDVAGSAHVDQTLFNGLPMDSDLLAETGSTAAETVQNSRNGCKLPGPISTFPDQYVYDSLWANLEAWVRNDVSPPHASPFRGFDIFGNALGGLRSPALDVPLKTYYSGYFGAATATSGSVSLPCAFLGYEKAFSTFQLGMLYPAKALYVNAVTNDVNHLRAAGFLTDYDAAALIQSASKATIP
jgi:hypothetical protein